ncbi:MAG: hypothetical protein M0Q23_05520 [Syntrophales bacterium]|jgi:uncharacterized integral membrane protein|nr:hypothetical protein [Syntrophales bacterium]MCK9528095.1 hypothetical protein [Syntrophales bacterium]MDX9922309.1 hypothetical protein [Syntrophales bacterium]
MRFCATLSTGIIVYGKDRDRLDGSIDLPSAGIVSAMKGNPVMSRTRSIVVLVILILFGIILLQNAEETSLKLLFWNISMSRIIFFPLLFVSGLVVGFILGRVRRSRHRR